MIARLALSSLLFVTLYSGCSEQQVVVTGSSKVKNAVKLQG